MNFRCLNCEYDLRVHCTEETPTGECPECGVVFDRQKLIELARPEMFPPQVLRVLILLSFFPGMSLAASFWHLLDSRPVALFFALLALIVNVGLAYGVNQHYAAILHQHHTHRPMLQRHQFWFIAMLLFCLAICWSMTGCVALPCCFSFR